MSPDFAHIKVTPAKSQSQFYLVKSPRAYPMASQYLEV